MNFVYRWGIKSHKSRSSQKNYTREQSTIGQMEPELDDQAEAPSLDCF
jgi:hypothetical protein